MAPTSKNTDENIIHVPLDVKIDINRALSEYVLEKLEEHSQKIAQIDSHTDRKETFGELLKRSISLAQALKRKGVTTEDVVGLCCHNNMDYMVVIIASIFNGSKFCAFDISAPKPDIIHCIKLTAPAIMFCEQELMLESSIKEAGIKCEIVTFDKTEKFISMDNFVERFQSEEVFKINTSRKMLDTGCISFTSGTSGLSKGAQLTNYGLYFGGINAERTMPVAEQLLMFTLPYWISNISTCFISIISGVTRIIMKQFELETLIKVVQDYEVNHTLFTQHVMNDLIKNPQVCNFDTTCLTYTYFGGSKIGSNQIAEIRKLFPHTKFLNAFGMTEMAGLVFISKPELTIDKEDNISVGTPIPGHHYKIVDVYSGECLGPHNKGELRIKFVGVMNGYLHQPDVTKEAFDEDGYLKTGDIVYYDDDCNFFLVDRLKEIFKYKGYHISPVLIEDTLSLHPNVKECAIIPVPHEHDGDIPMAVIKLTENAKATEEDFVQFIKERLSNPYHLRAGVTFVDSIPRTSTGKLQRKKIKELVLKNN